MSEKSGKGQSNSTITEFGFKPTRVLERSPTRARLGSTGKRKASESAGDLSNLPTYCCDISAEIGELKNLILENNNSVLNLTQQFSEFRLQMAGLSEDVNKLKIENSNLLATNTDLKIEISQLKTKQMDLVKKIDSIENRQRRDNVVFYNVPAENPTEAWSVSKIKIEDILKKANIVDVQIDRAHRIGKYSAGSAPIIAKIPGTTDRETILKSWKSLKELGISVSQDYSPEMRKKRALLNTFRKKAVQEGKIAKLRFDRLDINGEIYVCNDSVTDLINLKQSRKTDVTPNDSASNDITPSDNAQNNIVPNDIAPNNVVPNDPTTENVL